MKRKLSNQFFVNYLIVFLMSVLAAASALMLLSFSDSIISKTLMKNVYPASSIMRDNYAKINPSLIIQNGGGVQVINKRYEVVYSGGVDTIGKTRLTASEFTNFLVQSKSVRVPYHYDIAYNDKGEFWLIVTFPVSVRLDFSVAYNREAASRDTGGVAAVFLVVLLFYLLLLALFAGIYSRITAVRITNPLQKLCEGARLLREGNYRARVDLRLKNEFAELQDTFNDMAEKIESEIDLRKRSEENRRKLILDVSHDLKNPLASVAGYAELCIKKEGLSQKEQADYLQIIYNNSQRANRLLTELFELSKLESPEFSLRLSKIDVCEYLRQTCGELLPLLERAGFNYEFDIPEETFFALVDSVQLGRVFHNLADNAIRYNPEGTTILVSVTKQPEGLAILFGDNGVGIPAPIAQDIFKPFVRSDSNNPNTGGTGLGLAIAQKIVNAHGGTLTLHTDENQGCVFTVTLPTI